MVFRVLRYTSYNKSVLEHIHSSKATGVAGWRRVPKCGCMVLRGVPLAMVVLELIGVLPARPELAGGKLQILDSIQIRFRFGFSSDQTSDADFDL